MYSGEFAKDIKELGVDVADLESVDGIKSVKIVKAGIIEIALATEFGSDKVLQIQPSVSKSGQFIEWKCKTNLEQTYLGPTNNTSCIFDQSISLGSN